MTTIRKPRARQSRSLALLVFASGMVFALTALAQRPSDAEISAIRSACRSDYIASCRSVPTGGAESLNCLKRNFSKNSPTCQQALRPLMAPSQPPASAQPTSPAKASKSAPAAGS